MSNRHLLPNLTDQHQQRKLQTYIQNAEASIKQLPGSNPLIHAEIQLNELAQCTSQLNQILMIVGQSTPLFDINAHVKEGVTNVAGLDQHYMAVIGKQVINDYYVYRDKAVALSGRIRSLQEKFMGAKQNPTEEILTDILAEATFIHGEYVDWVDSFMRVVGSALHDLIDHLNLHRPEDRKINQPFPDQHAS